MCLSSFDYGYSQDSHDRVDVSANGLRAFGLKNAALGGVQQESTLRDDAFQSLPMKL